MEGKAGRYISIAKGVIAAKEARAKISWRSLSGFDIQKVLSLE